MRNRYIILLLFFAISFLGCNQKSNNLSSNNSIITEITIEKDQENYCEDNIKNETIKDVTYPIVKDVRNYFDKIIEFEPLSDDEIIQFERIDAINWGIQFFVFSETKKTKRIISKWANCLSTPQIVDGGKGYFFTVTNFESTNDWLFFIDGKSGTIKYLIDISRIYRSTIDGKYLIYANKEKNKNSFDIQYFEQYEIEKMVVNEEYTWRPKNNQYTEEIFYMLQRRNGDEIHIFAYAEDSYFAELSINTTKREMTIIWDLTDQKSSSFELEDDEDLLFKN